VVRPNAGSALPQSSLLCRKAIVLYYEAIVFGTIAVCFVVKQSCFVMKQSCPGQKRFALLQSNLLGHEAIVLCHEAIVFGMKPIFSAFEAAVSTGKPVYLPSRQESVESRRFSEGRIDLRRP
jgi:hypothetical protein